MTEHSYAILHMCAENPNFPATKAFSIGTTAHIVYSNQLASICAGHSETRAGLTISDVYKVKFACPDLS